MERSNKSERRSAQTRRAFERVGALSRRESAAGRFARATARNKLERVGAGQAHGQRAHGTRVGRRTTTPDVDEAATPFSDGKRANACLRAVMAVAIDVRTL